MNELTNPATMGYLIFFVREAWKNKIVISIGDGWFVVEAEGFYQDQKSAASLVEALVCALESAPDEDEALTES